MISDGGAALTVADVALLPEDLYYELIDGALVLPPPALPLHQITARKIANALDVGCPADVVPACFQSVMISEHDELRPDVVLVDICAADMTPVPADHVLLVVEVLSAESVVRDLDVKRGLYARGGIPSYWVVDPQGEKFGFTQFLLGDGEVYHRHVETTDVATVDVPWEITLDLPAWTRYRDRVRQAARSASRPVIG